MSNLNVEAWLVEKGWSKSDQWWLPPSGSNAGPRGRYKAKCYTFREAATREAELRGSTYAFIAECNAWRGLAHA